MAAAAAATSLEPGATCQALVASAVVIAAASGCLRKPVLALHTLLKVCTTSSWLLRRTRFDDR
jgi:hypothetical protein